MGEVERGFWEYGQGKGEFDASRVSIHTSRQRKKALEENMKRAMGSLTIVKGVNIPSGLAWLVIQRWFWSTKDFTSPYWISWSDIPRILPTQSVHVPFDDQPDVLFTKRGESTSFGGRKLHGRRMRNRNEAVNIEQRQDKCMTG